MSEHLASSLIELMPADVRYEFYTRRLRFNRRNVGKGSRAVLTAEKIQRLKFHGESPRLDHRQAIPLSRIAR